jgi:hypothetical protein
MNLGSLLRGVAGGRRGAGHGTGGHGTGGGARPAAGGGIGETVGRAVDGQMAGRRGTGAGGGGLGGMLRKFGRGRF